MARRQTSRVDGPEAAVEDPPESSAAANGFDEAPEVRDPDMGDHRAARAARILQGEDVAEAVDEAPEPQGPQVDAQAAARGLEGLLGSIGAGALLFALRWPLGRDLAEDCMAEPMTPPARELLDVAAALPPWAGVVLGRSAPVPRFLRGALTRVLKRRLAEPPADEEAPKAKGERLPPIPGTLP